MLQLQLQLQLHLHLHLHLQLKQANTVWLYLRVVTITDLSNTKGTFIPNGMLNGDWQAGSNLKWPY